MQGPISDFNYTGLVGETQDAARDEVFAKTMEGIYAATIILKTFKATEEDPSSGYVYRKFFYNEKGEVVKKLSFTEEGDIEMKEEVAFEKGSIVSARFITADNILREDYEYDDAGNLLKYTFTNPKQTGQKYEMSEIDEKGRIVKTTSIGLLGTPELISHYLYPVEVNKRYTYKHVTKGDGSLLMTFYFTYDSDKDDSNLTALYGFYSTPEEINNLLQRSGDNDSWEQESLFRSKWQYTEGKQTFFERDEQIKPYHLDYGYLSSDERIITDRTNFFYDEINGKKYPIRVIDWQTRFLEPCKLVKEYQYYDGEGNKIYPPDTAGEPKATDESASFILKQEYNSKSTAKKKAK